jgi:hypothetical protein
VTTSVNPSSPARPVISSKRSTLASEKTGEAGERGTGEAGELRAHELVNGGETVKLVNWELMSW